jgi:hypothetical protein
VAQAREKQVYAAVREALVSIRRFIVRSVIQPPPKYTSGIVRIKQAGGQINVQNAGFSQEALSMTKDFSMGTGAAGSALEQPAGCLKRHAHRHWLAKAHIHAGGDEKTIGIIDHHRAPAHFVQNSGHNAAMRHARIASVLGINNKLRKNLIFAVIVKAQA